VNFIWLIVSQVWPLLHTTPYLKLSDVLIWSSIFLAMDIHIVVFLCYEVACGQVYRRKSQERPPLSVCEHGDLLHFEFTSASVSSLNIVTPPPCFIRLQLFLIFTFAPCICLHLLHLKPTHALILTDNPQTGTPDTHTHRRHTVTYRKGKWRSKQRKSGKFTKY
jgi:hypothetical protein